MLALNKKKYSSKELMLAPLIDIVFLLLIFFVLTSSIQKKELFDLELPSSETSSASVDDFLTVSISKENKIFFEDKELNLESLKMAISKKLSKSPEIKTALVTQKTTNIQTVISVMDELRKAGASKTSLRTIEER